MTAPSWERSATWAHLQVWHRLPRFGFGAAPVRLLHAVHDLLHDEGIATDHDHPVCPGDECTGRLLPIGPPSEPMTATVCDLDDSHVWHALECPGDPCWCGANDVANPTPRRNP